MRRELQSLCAKGGGTIWNALRFALRINSGIIILFSRLSRPAGRSKRIFTGGVVTENGIYSAAFCESAALWEYPLSLCCAKPDSPFCRCATSSPGRGKSALKGTPLGYAGNFAATPEAVPLGKVAANVVSRRKGWFPGLQVSS